MTDLTTAPDRIRLLIVDDEPPARARLERMLAELPDVKVVGEAANGRDALAAVTKAGGLPGPARPPWGNAE